MDSKGKEITPEEKKIILRLRKEGKTLRAIGKIVERTHSSIQRMINNYKLSKSVISKILSGPLSKLTFREKRHPEICPFKSKSYMIFETDLKKLHESTIRKFL